MARVGGARSGTVSWPLAFTIVATLLILAGLSLYVFKSLRDLPSDVVDQGREVLDDVRRIAKAFTTGTVTTSFTSYATEVSGSNYLQFASLQEVEIFERQDSATTLWGQLELPDVVVQARAPVEYTYYLDLNGKWEFWLDEEEIHVLAPRIEFNRPAVDASAMRYEIRSGSVFRDEDGALQSLRAGVMVMAEARAKENVELVRELGRRKTAEFVENWVAQSFSDGGSYQIKVRFADERVEVQTGDGEAPLP